MRVVVADTGPLHYLVLIGEIDLLPQLFEAVIVPEIVCNELRHPRTPKAVREWLAKNPFWLKPTPTPPIAVLPLQRLGDGERAAIALASSVSADLILMDDSAGVTAARARGFAVIGTIGILDLAAGRGLIDIADAIGCLKATNFRYPSTLLDALLAQYGKQT